MGHTVAELLRDGRNLNLQLVRRGQAFAYRQSLRRCDAATIDRLGVWAQPGGLQRPWQFRRQAPHGSDPARQGARSPRG